MHAAPHLRWWIAGLLFAASVINYIDRQTFAALAPILKSEYHWTNTDFASILIAFRISYTIMQSVGGRILDRLGTRRGLGLAVTFYSVVAMLTAFAQGLNGFRFFRFLLGAGEGPNFPAATKAVSEWFSGKERAWAVAMFDSGTSIGGAVAPFLALFAYRQFHSWRPVFLLTGSLGLVWMAAWWRLYPVPSGRSDTAAAVRSTTEYVGWTALLRFRQTWGLVLGRFLLDPYWFLVSDWFAIYLLSNGYQLEQSILGYWVPFLAADLGNFFGGGLSSYWISRGWTVGAARRGVLLIFGPSMLVLSAALFTKNYVSTVLLFGYASFAYAACSTMFLSLPADMFQARVVGSVSGLAGTGAGCGTLISTYWIGRITDKYSFQPVVLAASLVPCLATAAFVILVRRRRSDSDQTIFSDA